MFSRIKCGMYESHLYAERNSEAPACISEWCLETSDIWKTEIYLKTSKRRILQEAERKYKETM
jgi:hypothetical protein